MKNTNQIKILTKPKKTQTNQNTQVSQLGFCKCPQHILKLFPRISPSVVTPVPQPLTPAESLCSNLRSIFSPATQRCLITVLGSRNGIVMAVCLYSSSSSKTWQALGEQVLLFLCF